MGIYDRRFSYPIIITVKPRIDAESLINAGVQVLRHGNSIELHDEAKEELDTVQLHFDRFSSKLWVLVIWIFWQELDCCKTLQFI